jgi:hypothetical protein
MRRGDIVQAAITTALTRPAGGRKVHMPPSGVVSIQAFERLDPPPVFLGLSWADDGDIPPKFFACGRNPAPNAFPSRKRRRAGEPARKRLHAAAYQWIHTTGNDRVL